MIILSIETSCDETAVAIVKFNKNKVEVLANIVSSQIKMHSKYGGVVPSLASRMHLKNMIPVLKRALKKANINLDQIDSFAVTNGPGLIPALMVGVSCAKSLSYFFNKPLIPVHHIEGHVYANWLKVVDNFKLWKPEFPILCLTVSGGHTQLILMKKDLNYKVIGETVDDAVGEAFDKVAKLLNLGYPGGPLIEKFAKIGDKNRFNFTRPMINSGNFNFSFSGLKTAVLYETQKVQKMDKKYKQDIAASFQQVVIDVLVSKTIKAAQKYKVKNIIIGGGVSANSELKRQINEKVNEELFGVEFHFPSIDLTTDNALMIAVAAYKHIESNKGIGDWKSVKADSNIRLKY
ncbi:MAG: tRNA (adenosine(37)-N6)-threonylcarbamoyltransferase complex transferase subunit TsaD [Patescibacteria group bacterium]|nr:tRNA (adenosine(37)-N6)-threonylcarbamoyltransferase complex transferase subunit TsaD [Patescibacteria group bacterium]